jgi:hypothetical protein
MFVETMRCKVRISCIHSRKTRAVRCPVTSTQACINIAEEPFDFPKDGYTFRVQADTLWFSMASASVRVRSLTVLVQALVIVCVVIMCSCSYTCEGRRCAWWSSTNPSYTLFLHYFAPFVQSMHTACLCRSANKTSVYMHLCSSAPVLPWGEAAHRT